jgi:hypothetical protein
MDDVLWTTEEALWRDGIDAYRIHMAASCLMLFGPMGILDRPAILQSLEDAPRWSAVRMEKRQIASSGQTATIAYEAFAEREDGSTYRALCSSTYVDEAGAWKILQHQQTPL